MKLASDDAICAINELQDAVKNLRNSLRYATLLLERENLPEPDDRFVRAALSAGVAEALIGYNSNVGENIRVVLRALEDLADELPL